VLLSYAVTMPKELFTAKFIALRSYVDANSEQVRRGMAWVFVRYASKGSQLYGLEAEAKAQRLGLWSQPHPIAPWKWRAAERQH
jgi:endonuclease YncB( thermonuclease family)